MIFSAQFTFADDFPPFTIQAGTYRELIRSIWNQLHPESTEERDTVSPIHRDTVRRGDSHSPDCYFLRRRRFANGVLRNHAHLIFSDGSPSFTVQSDSFHQLLRHIWRRLHAYDPAILDDLADENYREEMERHRRSQSPIKSEEGNNRRRSRSGCRHRRGQKCEFDCDDKSADRESRRRSRSRSHERSREDRSVSRNMDWMLNPKGAADFEWDRPWARDCMFMYCISSIKRLLYLVNFHNICDYRLDIDQDKVP